MRTAFFHHLEIDAADADRFPDAIRRMRSGAIDGLLVRNVYSAADCDRIRDRLEAGTHRLVRMGFPAAMRAWFLGINLNLAPSDLSAYFQEVPRFHAGLSALFAGMADLWPRIATLLASLDQGRPYRPAPGPGPGITHMVTTLRAHPPGGFIPPHFDNEQAFRDSYRHVNQGIGADLYSFVLAFTRAEAGGALEIFDLHHQGRVFRMADGPQEASRLSLDGVPSIGFRLAPGELILFNSGRLLHRVTPVIGTRTRWTACSFMAESRDGTAVHCWG